MSRKIVIEIEGCGKCPFVKYQTVHETPDTVKVKCGHPSVETEFFKTKIRNVNYSFYNECPEEVQEKDFY